MESRKRFRADISDSYIDTILDKKRHKPGEQRQPPGAESAVKSVTIIPSEMLPDKSKLAKRTLKDYKKPDHWIRPEQAPKLSRAQVLEVERDNIKKIIHEQQVWSRAARHLTSAINPSNNSPISDDPIKDTGKNRSKEFLDTFFKKANSIAAESAKKKSIVKKVPKLASGVEPGVEEIVL